MKEPISPEENLDREIRKQERDLHSYLFHINQLFLHCCDESLSMDTLYDKCKPILERIRPGNSIVAQEIEELLQNKDREKLLEYFEQEKQQLIQLLGDEIQQCKAIDKRINDTKIERYPTDS